MLDDLTAKLFVLVVLGGLALSVLVLAHIAYQSSPWREAREKHRLLRALRQSRFAEVLARLNVPLAQHVSRTPGADLRREIARCKQCRHRAKCFVALRSQHSPVPLVECPNGPDLQRYARRRPLAG